MVALFFIFFAVFLSVKKHCVHFLKLFLFFAVVTVAIVTVLIIAVIALTFSSFLEPVGVISFIR